MGHSHGTLKQAEIIRSHQGNHEVEVTCGGETDLHKHYIKCKKNPGHTQFIPVQDFNKEHLPPDYRDNVIVDWIKSEADRTCRLSVDYTSENRPKHHPVRKHASYPFSQVRGSDSIRVGTGIMSRVYKFNEEDNVPCQCDECSGIHTPHKVWGLVEILTAMHVVFDDDEARRTTCHFGYDTNKTWLSDCLKLTGFKVAESDVAEDRCHIMYITHDMDIVNKLYEMWSHCRDLWENVCDKYWPNKNTSISVPRASCLTDPKPAQHVVIISHPHGLSKHISVGMWTHRQTWGEIVQCEFNDGTGREYVGVATSYTYNAHTCPGSSGGPVFRLWMKGQKWWEWVSYHPHSEGGEGNTNNNKSAVSVECASEPIRPKDK